MNSYHKFSHIIRVRFTALHTAALLFVQLTFFFLQFCYLLAMLYKALLIAYRKFLRYVVGGVFVFAA